MVAFTSMLRVLLAALLVLFGAGRGLGDAHAQPAPPPAAVETPSIDAALEAVHVQLNLLLDLYPLPLSPATLLDAAWRGVLSAAATPEPVVDPLPDARDVAWAMFLARFREIAGTIGAAPGDLARAANQAMARSVDDCHTRFAPSYDREIRQLAGPERYGGIGASVLDGGLFDPPAPGPVLVHLVAGAPGAQSGLRPGDAVIAVDGVSTAGFSSSRVVDLVRGQPETTVVLRVERPGVPEPLDVVVRRDYVVFPVIETYLVPAIAGGAPAGYIRFRSFSPQSSADLLRAIDELRAQGAGSWVLDLRENGGGDLHAFVQVASAFIQQGTLAVMTDRAGNGSRVRANSATYREFTRPLAVLVDGRSASAAELLAADLQEYGAARLFGTTTAGCFGTSRPYRLPDGSALWLTMSTLKSGLQQRDVHMVGVVPDEIVTRSRADLAAGSDPPLARALDWLQSASAATPTG